MAQQQPQRMIEGQRGPEYAYAPPPPPRLSFGQLALRTVPILAAVISTGLLAYFVLFAQRSEPSMQAQQPPAPVQPASQPTAEQIQPVQQEAPSQYAQTGAPGQSPQDAPAPPDVAAGAPLGMPPAEVMILMIRSTVLALSQANATGNYTVFRQLGSPTFQRNNSSARIAAAFAKLRARNLDLSPILLLIPKLYRAPEINNRGMMRVNGFFPSQPDRVNFDLLFQQVGNKWMLFGAAVDVVPPKPASPQAAAPARQPQPGSQAAPKAAAPAKPAKPQASAPQKPDSDVRDRVDEAETPKPPESSRKAPAEQDDGFSPFGR